ncbi:MAG: shikimate dehydrogenase [Hydrogenophaga sp.]|nr:shikimate dehydrogenase [Hydrogenophaga sp.]
MDRYAVVGHPVAHSQSPAIHARFAELTGQALTYERLELPLDGFLTGIEAARAAGLRGGNVTVPFKLEAFAWAQHRSARAELAQACNTFWFEADGVHGDNTDGIGLVRDITRHAGVALRGARVLLVGAGGAGAGVLGPLLSEGPAELVLSNRTVARAQDVVDHHAGWARRHDVRLVASGLMDVAGAFDVVINATAASLQGAEPPLPTSAIGPGTLVVDMMYGPKAEPFAAWARSHGATVRDGLGMLVEQAAEAFFVWRGVMPPAAQVLAERRALLAT